MDAQEKLAVWNRYEASVDELWTEELIAIAEEHSILIPQVTAALLKREDEGIGLRLLLVSRISHADQISLAEHMLTPVIERRKALAVARAERRLDGEEASDARGNMAKAEKDYLLHSEFKNLWAIVETLTGEAVSHVAAERLLDETWETECLLFIARYLPGADNELRKRAVSKIAFGHSAQNDALLACLPYAEDYQQTKVAQRLLQGETTAKEFAQLLPYVQETSVVLEKWDKLFLHHRKHGRSFLWAGARHLPSRKDAAIAELANAGFFEDEATLVKELAPQYSESILLSTSPLLDALS